MSLSREEKHALMRDARYPLSSKYDPDWIMENELGSHCLWLLESLLQVMEIKPGMRILDMGCGKAISSIFLAKEFGVQVFANDLWISATDNWKRILEAGVEHLVFPIHAEAHALPYADEFFDAVVSINCLQFFATEPYYLKNHFARLVKPGGQIGIIVPGLYKEFEDELPPELVPYWEPEFYSWHSPDWWRRHWKRSGRLDVEIADTLPDKEGSRIFLIWEDVMDHSGLIGADAGRNISFVRVTARRK